MSPQPGHHELIGSEEIDEPASLPRFAWNRREVKDCPDLLQLGRSTLPTSRLQIHYRSKYRELIAFSNSAYYQGDLNVPARHPDSEVNRAKPIEVVRVNGVYEDQSNEEEAEAVVGVPRGANHPEIDASFENFFRVPDDAAIAMALIENIQRENLNPLEEARALDRLIREFGVTHQQAADAVGRSRAGVSNLLRLLELAPEVDSLVEKRALEMGHARALLGLSTRRDQADAAAIVVEKGLSVRETEALVRQRSQPAAAKPGKAPGSAPGRDANIAELERSLSDRLGAKVELQSVSAGRGRLVVHYHSLDELDGILAHIK